MRITALVKGTEHVCCRYRVAAFQQRLRRAGHPLDLRGWPESWLERWELYRHLKETDALFVQRKLLPPWQLKLVRRRVSRLIFDYDDSIFLRNSYNPLGHDSPRRSQRFEEMIRSADAVIAGNAFLAEQAHTVADPARIHVIPTCVDVARYPLARHSPEKKLVEMAWVGSSSTIQGLEKIAPILELLGKTIPCLQLKVICDRSLPLEHLSVDFCPWDEATEAAELAAADIGISWLPDDLWSRGKCGLKVLQYMAAGLPVVANPVGLQVDLVRPGETGFLADTPEEWLHAVHLLASDPELRRKMGWAARRRVEAEFSVAAGSTAWLRVLDALEQAAVPRVSA